MGALDGWRHTEEDPNAAAVRLSTVQAASNRATLHAALNW